MITRNLEKAREAFLKRDKKLSKSAYNSSSGKEKHKKEGKYIKSAVYGGLDGIITTFAVVAGVAGASLSAGIVLILGFANLIADGISMAVGDFLSTKAENEYNRAERKREEWEVDNYSEGEKKEVFEIYRDKGMSKKDALKMTNILSKNKKAWVNFMMTEELKIIESEESPLKNSVVTFSSFCIFGLIPLLAYLFSGISFFTKNTFLIACFMTVLTLFLLGSAKTKVTGRNWIKSGLETVLVGGFASGAAYLIGYLLQGLAG